ncbi:hypothetical protein [Hymenobacter sp. IS2118]|uniref:hypothetical protein n=1 Tax=Hymenobacter sp. IS2118 TaxID=1505605 RepID=UPI000557601F|nr:hypothetical protein [Hymenobacter sp. IS2118]
MPRKVYCSLEALDEIFDDPTAFADLYHIVRDYHDVVLNLPEEALEKAMLSNPYVRSLFKRGTYGVDCETEFYGGLPDDLAAITAGGLFILDQAPDVCARLSSRHGICVLSVQDPTPAQTLTTHYYRQMEKADAYEVADAGQTQERWPALLAPLGKLPMNSLLLVDNYLFSSFKEGKRNLLSLLDGLLPSTLHEEFHLLLVTTNPRNVLNPEVLAALFTEMRTTLNRPYTIVMGLLTHGDTDRRFHRRAWVSNYHFGSSDRGFACFGEDGRVNAHNDIRIQGAFRDARVPYGDVPWRSMQLELKSAAALRNHNQQQGGWMATNLLYGNCNNRLLDLAAS